jgi:hypothetical protein
VIFGYEKITLGTDMVNTKLAWLLLISFIGLLLAFWMQDYDVLYTLLVAYCALAVLVGSRLSKVLAIFFGTYLGIACLNISDYRGSVEVDTLRLYVLSIMLTIAICDLIYRTGILVGSGGRTECAYSGKGFFILFLKCHLLLVFGLIGLITAEYGNVLLNESLRLSIPTGISYAVKSTVYIPLILFFYQKGIIGKKRWLYSLLCMAPTVYIGARGMVVMILIGIVLGQYLMPREREAKEVKEERSDALKTKNLSMWKFVPVGIVGTIVVVGIAYLRRLNSDVYLAPLQMLKEYFGSSSLWLLPFAPIYLNLRETVGISNIIISRHIVNSSVGVPLFFEDLFTVLPGSQEASGQVLAGIIGSAAGGGLTPGLLGGLYLDWGASATMIFPLIFAIGAYLMRLARRSDAALVLGLLTLVQLFHLFHRGFLKPEYFTAYIICWFYIVLIKIKVPPAWSR